MGKPLKKPKSLIQLIEQPRGNRYARKNSQGGQSSIYQPAPEYDDPANCAEEDQYVTYLFFYGFHFAFMSFS